MSRQENKRIIDYINSHFDEFMRNMESLNPEEYVLAFTELLKLIIDDEEE